MPRRRKATTASGRIRDAYHHGDLRAALIAAAEEELAERGVEGFTLRGCARRAGVSHAAPAHHFRDVRALLTVLATIGFRRLAETTERFGRSAPLGTVEHFAAVGRGYVTFAMEHPAYFRLIFRTSAIDGNDPDYLAAGRAAFSVPVRAVGAYFGSDDPMADPALVPVVIGLWSIVQGFSELMVTGQIRKGAPGADVQDLVDRLIPVIVTRFVAGEARSRAAAPESKSRRQGRRRSHSKSIDAA